LPTPPTQIGTSYWHLDGIPDPPLGDFSHIYIECTDAETSSARPIPGTSTDSDETMEQASRWITECTEKHDCLRDRDKSFWPTRVLDIQLQTQDDHFKLVEKDDILKEGSYVTLSHCWGHTSHLLLLKDNIGTFKSVIPLSDLPKTYVHAIKIARRLGLRYLWIDSLCEFSE
jgi:hypothetical protein